MAPTMIANPQSSDLPKVKGPEMNDRDWINDILAFEKYLTNGYNTALNEIQNPKLFETIKVTLNDIHDIQHDIFNKMFDKGWYKLLAADAEEIGKTHKQFSNYSSQFPDFN
jgi:spore coat protein CotF